MALSETRPIAVISACMNNDGTPTFAFNEVFVTPEEAENGLHYELVEVQLLKAGHDEPFVHCDQHEAPAFLHDAVRRHLGLPRISLATPIPSEASPCA